MNGLELLPQLALACAAGALATSVLDARAPGGRPRMAAWSRRLLVASAALASAAFLTLLWLFIQADVSYEVVFLYTKTTLPLRWRVAGTWAGREGSLLLWTALVAVTAALFARAESRRMADDEATTAAFRWTRLVLALYVVAFLAAVVAQRTFAATPAFFLEGRPDGNGLNPTLKSPFILIHPPLMFVAYALATVPAAAAFAHLATGTDRWSTVGLTWARVDWLVYTFAMGLGGIWAYYTLGFGGYWAWDPVEVANLLPWLALTVFLHAQLHHARHGGYRVAGPVLALLPFLLTLFSTLSTRSGLWVSVHAFTDPTNTFNPDAPARFLDILEVEPSLVVYVRLFLATLGLGLALWALRMAREHRTLQAATPWIAGAFTAAAAYAAIAPRSALSLLFETADTVAMGRPGYGLLALGFGSVLVAALPALLAKPPEPESRSGPRITMRSLAAYSVAVLGLGLLVLFLFHMAAVNGWDEQFYVARLPLLAAPAALGLFVLQAHSIHGRKRSLVMAAVILAAAVLLGLVGGDHRAGWALMALTVPLLVVSLDKVRRTGLPPGVGKRERLGPTLLWLGALLDLLFWLNPPANVLGWRPVWPAQLFLGGLALYALWGAQRILAGAAPRAPWHVHALVAALGGFLVAPVLALAAFLLQRRTGLRTSPLDAKARARLRQVALYGAHLAVAVALVGYGLSTYWKETEQVTLEPGQTVDIGGAELALASTTMRVPPGSPFADQLRVHLDVQSGGRTQDLTAHLTYEPDVGAYFPLPATLRTWRGDLYVNVDDVQVATSACSGERTIQAYQAASPPQACQGDTFGAVTIDATWLPGLGLVWLALALFVASMALLLAMEPRREPTPMPVEVPT